MINEQLSPFDQTLDRCIQAIHLQGRSVEDCLALYPDDRDALEPLLRLVVVLRSASSLNAPADFRRSARQRMLNLTAASPHRPSRVTARGNVWDRIRASVGLRRSWAAVALLVVFLIMAATTTVRVSANALPGDWLYPVKLSLENTRLFFSTDRGNRIELMLDLARQRFNELVLLAQRQHPTDLDRAAQTYTDQLNSTLVVFAQPASLAAANRDTLVERLNADLEKEEAELTALISQQSIPQEYVDELRQVLVLIQTTRDQADQWLPILPPHLPGVNPPISWPTWEFPGEDQPTPTPTPRPIHTPQPTPPDFSETDMPWVWPTEWPTEWPDLEKTPIPDPQWTEVNEPWPTLRPLPTQFPTGFPDDLPDPPDWPDFPDDQPDESPPGWFTP